MENSPTPGNTPHLEAVELQLSACRAMLAIAYRERNAAEVALVAAEAELAQLRSQQRMASALLRTWFLRLRAIQPSVN